MAKRSAAAGRASVAAARSSGSSGSVKTTTNTARPSGGLSVGGLLAQRAAARLPTAPSTKGTVPASPADIRRYQLEEANAQKDLAAAGYSPEFINQVQTFWQGIAALPQDQQDKIMGQLKSQANSTVDYGFDSEQAYLKQLKDAKQGNYDEQLRLFKEQENADLAKNIGETDRGTASQLQGAYAGLSKNNAFDTGVMNSLADRAIEGRNRVVKDDTDVSARAIASAQQQRDSAGNLLSIQAEQDLNDVSNRRTAARSQRLSQLIGLNAGQQLLAQVPTLTQMSVPKPAATPATKTSTAPLSLPSLDAGSRNTTDSNMLLRRGSVTYGYANDRARASYRGRAKLIGNY